MRKGDKGKKVWGLIVILAVWLILNISLVQAVYQCGSYTDDCYCGMSNPYSAVTINNCDDYFVDACDGNCAWWAWHQACYNWGVGLPKWGNPKDWTYKAQQAGYLVSSTPAVGTIGCRASGTYGHVAWIIEVSGGKVKVSEMNFWNTNGGPCDKEGGMRYRWYDKGFFNEGYLYQESILPAPNLYSPTDNAQDVSTTPYFDWSSVSGANRYWLMVAENENDLPDDPNAESCPNCVISEMFLTSTSYTPSTPLAEGTTYYWQVQAFEWDGSSVTRQGEFSEHIALPLKQTQ